MTYQVKLEPRTERVGLFPLENPLTQAIKEINNTKLSIKRSTRGFTVLYKNKPMNPVLAGKDRDKIEKLLHRIFATYVKFLVLKEISTFKFELIHERDLENELLFVFNSPQRPENKIIITISKITWTLLFDLDGEIDKDFEKIINSLISRIGKIIN